MPNSESASDDKSIDQLDPVIGRHNTFLSRKDDIEKFVELPLQSACGIFWDKNIRTLSSSANKNNLEGDAPAFIIIDYLSLSVENKKIVDELIKNNEAEMVWNKKAVSLIYKLKGNEKVSSIQQKFNDLAGKFSMQSPNWIPVSNIEVKYYINNDEGNFYDEESKLYYFSQDHRDLVKKYQETDKNWVPHFSLEQLIRDQLTNDGRVASDLENYDPKYDDIEFWVKEKKYYYDPNTKYFYLSEKDCEKFNGKDVAKNLQGETLEAVEKILNV